MKHLRIFNGNAACGSRDAQLTDFIALVNCENCTAWHQTNAFALKVVGASFDREEDEDPYEYDEDAFEEANADMNNRLYAEHRDRLDG